MKRLGMGLYVVKIDEVVVFFMPRRVADFGQHVLEVSVLPQVIQVQRTEVETEITQMAEQKHVTVDGTHRLA